MYKCKFSDFAINCTEKRTPTPLDYATYIGLEHLDTKNLKVVRWGSDVPIIGDKLVMHKGDVLFGKRNTYLKRAAIAPHDGLFSAHGMVLRPKENVVDRDFFSLFISSDYFFDAAIRISVGSLSPTVNWSDLKNLEFILPDIGKQRKIAKVLWSIRHTIESYKNMIVETNNLTEAHFNHYLHKANGTKKLELGQLIEYMPKSKIKAGFGLDFGKFPLFNSSADLSKWSNEFLYDEECVILPTGGKAAVNYYKGKFACTTDNFVIKSKTEVATKFIYLFLRNNLNIIQDGFKGSGLEHVSKDYINSIKIIVPKTGDQTKLINLFETSQKSIDNLKSSIYLLEQIYNKIMAETIDTNKE